jgi:hypothetical protein
VFQHLLGPALQAAGQGVAKLIATPKPVESPGVSMKSQAPVPVPAPFVNPTQVDKREIVIIFMDPGYRESDPPDDLLVESPVPVCYPT